MRTIKFRGKRVDNGEWIYGYGTIDHNILHLDLYSGIVRVACVPDTVGQFTGLHDRNGKEIYEGDHFGNPKFHVYFDNGMFCLGGVPLIDYINGNTWEKIEGIAGNIYDTPEPLGENNDNK